MILLALNFQLRREAKTSPWNGFVPQLPQNWLCGCNGRW